MPVAAEIASMLDALDAPAMLIRPEDMTVAAVNEAFVQAYGRFSFEGKLCWEALHRARACPESGLACPLRRAGGVRTFTVQQKIFGSARVTELAVSSRAVLTADGRVLYWLETLRSRSDEFEPFRRGTVGVSAAHRRLMQALEEAASDDGPYLITGEPGVGKELYARTVHENSARASGPFVVACGLQLTSKAARGILCGGREGPGLFERAQSGTLFIDGIDAASPAALDILLSVLETGMAPCKGSREQPASVRIAASARAPGEGHPIWAAFLNRIIHVPALRERLEDVPVLAKFFVEGIAPVKSRSNTQEAVDSLMQYDWPGNMRELREVLINAAKAVHAGAITSAALPLPQRGAAQSGPGAGAIVPLDEAIDRYFIWAVEHFHGPRSELAEKLGISERTLYRLYAKSRKRLAAPSGKPDAKEKKDER